jgi:hypothetical protein
VHGLVPRGDIADYVAEVMRRVGLDPDFKRRYPHQFSGGQRQRIGIARALAVKPRFLVCDEAIAALDVSIQAQVLNLFMDLRQDLDLTYLFISHDLSAWSSTSPTAWSSCISAAWSRSPPPRRSSPIPTIPTPRPCCGGAAHRELRKRSFHPVKGEIPSPLDPPPGCHFHPRCPHAMARCRPLEGAGLLAARFPRAYIDPNRRLDDVDPALIEGSWPQPLNPGPKSALGIGLFRHRTNDGGPLLAGPLTVERLNARIERCWRPYRRALEESLDRLHARHGAVWHLDVHSMKSVGTAITPDGPGAERPDMVIGDLEGRSCDPAFTAMVAGRCARSATASR